MKLLIKKIARSELAFFFRNALNFKPVYANYDKIQISSVSDAFPWRTDNNFTTKFKYSDILNIFYNIKDSWVEFHFYDKNANFLKKKVIQNLHYSNELIINSDFLGGINDYGTFYIFHYSKSKIEKENIIANRCYIGFSKNNNLHSFVHGNTHVKFSGIYSHKVKTGIIKTSLFINKNYTIQKYFEEYDNNELFFVNPANKKISFFILNKKYPLAQGCSKIIRTNKVKTLNILSNCMFLRPTIFSYKKKFMDVHHS